MSADREGSPRTKVAYNFQGLHLDDGKPVSKFEHGPRRHNALHALARNAAGDAEPTDEEEAARKRIKGLNAKTGKVARTEVPETPAGKKDWKENKFTVSFGPERILDPKIADAAAGVVLSNEFDPMVFKGSPILSKTKESGLARAYPSINRLADSKSRTKKRAGTPPLSAPIDGAKVNEEESKIVDPERAALTWHDDEITGHNPTDPDDDGEGINGIGFRPTAAEAYQRAQKRRQQMAEYRNREARDARKLRSERRRGSEMSKSSKEEQETARRVRFLEVEARSVASAS